MRGLPSKPISQFNKLVHAIHLSLFWGDNVLGKLRAHNRVVAVQSNPNRKGATQNARINDLRVRLIAPSPTATSPSCGQLEKFI
jgi:hypothetical protein